MLVLRGARHHHLHDLDLDLVPGSWTAITGRSGSGKTSLVHDTLVAEGRRRWWALLSGPARQRLGKAGRPALDRLDGLLLPVAIGAAATGSTRSTVGTRSGLLDLLRLVWAREATADEPLRRSHFSFNQPLGACPDCQGTGLQDEVDPALLVADPTRSLRDGALVPTLKSGYTVYSQVTVDVMDQLCRAHGFTVDTPWNELDDAQRHMVLHGTDRLVVPFGKHDLASRMRWSGITARPREEGHYKGLIPVIEETLKRDRNPNILRFVRTVACAVCGGTRLGPIGRTAEVAGRTLPDLTRLGLRDLHDALAPVLQTPTGAAVAPSLRARLERLVDLELGHLSLDRTLPTLSGGEAQRLALAALLGTELSGLLYALDEPTLGLHPDAQPGLHRALEAVRSRGNTLITVEHDPDFVRHADRVVVLGPGSGVDGGRILHDGPTHGDPLGPPPTPRSPRPDRGTLWLRGARLHNLDGVDLPVRLGTLQVVLGPSGAGKSTLVMGCLLPELQGRADVTVVSVDASPLGRTPRSTPATWTGWFDVVRKRFAATDDARAAGFTASRFAYNSAAGRCPTCEGLGVERIRLHLLEDLLRPCPACAGSRYAPQTLTVRWRGWTIADVLQRSVAEAARHFADDDELAPVLCAMEDLGLGHLPLGQSSATLSRGEAQRVRLATTLARAERGGSPIVWLLDEPDRGLHPDDLDRLISVFDRLVAAGHTLVAISHHRHLWAAADHRVRVEDGRVELDPTLSWDRGSQASPRSPAPAPEALELRGVRTHNLRGIDVRLPHGALVGIVGVSGSGKSSLAIATLAAEADRRLAETLPFTVRRFLRRLPRPVLDAADGLTPTLLLRQGASGSDDPRSTVATALDIDAPLRLLVSRAGVPSGLSAAHFSPNRPEGACPDCHGRGTVRVADVDRLVTAPDKALSDGAMDGTKTGRYLGEPGGQHLATLAAALEHLGFERGQVEVPFRELPDDVRDVALHGAGDVELQVRWTYQRGRRTGEHTFTGPWRGLLWLAADEAGRRINRKDSDDWAAPLVDAPCAACGGTRLGAPARDVRVGPYTIADLRARRVDDLLDALDGLTDVFEALRPELAARLDDAVSLGLGALTLDTPVSTLGAADRQRLRLAGVLGSGLSGLTLVLDEPDAGLPDEALPSLLARLRGAVEAGNTVVVVTHRLPLIRGMDHLIELGEGDIVAEGTVAAVATADTPTARALASAEAPPPPTLTTLPDHGVIAVDGPLRDGAAGLERRQTVLDVVEGLAPLQRLFHAVGTNLPARAFSFRSPAGRCETCGGTGHEAVSLDVLADLRLPCPDCEGRRYRPEVLQVRWPATGDHVADWLARPVHELLGPLEADGSKAARALADAARALGEVGLGGVSFGRELRTLSGGEVQRVVLAAFSSDTPTVVTLDAPDRGLHEADLDRVVARLRALAAAGHLVLVAGARPSFVARLDGRQVGSSGMDRFLR